MGTSYSLQYTEHNDEQFDCKQEIIPKTSKLVSDSGIALLRGELLKNEIHNNQVDVKKRKYNNLLLRQINDNHMENIIQLQLENDILKKSLEKYKNLYRQLTIK